MLNGLIFIFGAIIGSFLNVVSLRYNTGQSIAFGHSRCFSCAKKLSWFELLPVASFLLLRGKCSSCKSKISWQYPLIEILSGSIFLLIFNFQLPIFNEFSIFNFLNLAILWTIFSLLIVIAIYDYYHQIIPNLFVYFFNGLSFLLLINFENFEIGSFFENFDLTGFLAGLMLFAFFALLWLVSKGRWMGFGDAKLALGMGWFLGFNKGIAALILAFWIGAIVGLALLYCFRNKYDKKSHIAFGPFMVAGTIIAFFWGEKLTALLF
ncbi:prepilin peptidase [Candidatus Parcubacteria bacterium]|nr:MAG: prepilin peptidase [Candidatus Parcubacteria bacterium]